MSETIAAVIIATMGSIVGSILIYVTALKKAKPESENLAADSDEHKANAVKTAIEGTEIVTKQLNASLADLSKEREARRLLEQKINEINDQVTLQQQKADKQRQEFETKLEEQRQDYEKKLYHQKAEFERKFDIMRGNMAALASQVVQLGGTPIKFMGDQ